MSELTKTVEHILILRISNWSFMFVSQSLDRLNLLHGTPLRFHYVEYLIVMWLVTHTLSWSFVWTDIWCCNQRGSAIPPGQKGNLTRKCFWGLVSLVFWVRADLAACPTTWANSPPCGDQLTALLVFSPECPAHMAADQMIPLQSRSLTVDLECPGAGCPYGHSNGWTWYLLGTNCS